MTTQNKTIMPQQGDLAENLEMIKCQLFEMQSFFARRFDEISMEINATSQQLDMAEGGIAGKFGEIMQVLMAISYQGEGSTAANAGVELEAVIGDTEQAANRILDAADRIANRVHTAGRWNDEMSRDQMLEETRNDVQEILMACTFQDLTGQRIRRTLDSLQLIESRLSSTLEKLGIDVSKSSEMGAKQEIEKNIAHSQSDIDALFS
jgi:chemotaxis regulatin CheY-phosphate phosphatase CheZ